MEHVHTRARERTRAAGRREERTRAAATAASGTARRSGRMQHRVPRRSSRHVSRSVAAGRGRRRRSRSCIPRWRLEVACFSLLFVRTRAASSPPPHVSRLRFALRRPTVNEFRRGVTVPLPSLHCPARSRADLLRDLATEGVTTYAYATHEGTSYLRITR